MTNAPSKTAAAIIGQGGRSSSHTARGSTALPTIDASEMWRVEMATPRKITATAVSAAELARKVELPVAEVLGRLTSLELEGAVRRQAGGYVRALRRGGGRA